MQIDRTHLAVKSLPSCKLRGLLWYQVPCNTASFFIPGTS